MSVAAVVRLLRWTHVACGTELSLPIFDLWTELLQQGFLHPPDGWRLTARLQSQLCTNTYHAGEYKVCLTSQYILILKKKTPLLILTGLCLARAIFIQHVQ